VGSYRPVRDNGHSQKERCGLPAGGDRRGGERSAEKSGGGCPPGILEMPGGLRGLELVTGAGD